MTPIERAAIKALGRCRFLPGAGVKRFSRDMAAKPDAYELSPGQQRFLWAMIHRFRRQLPEDIVRAGILLRLDPDVDVLVPFVKPVFGQKQSNGK